MPYGELIRHNDLLPIYMYIHTYIHTCIPSHGVCVHFNRQTRQHCRKLKSNHEKAQQEIEKLTKKVKNDKQEYDVEMNEIKERFWIKECESNAKLEEKSDIIYQLNLDIKKFVAELGKYRYDIYVFIYIYIYIYI